MNSKKLAFALFLTVPSLLSASHNLLWDDLKDLKLDQPIEIRPGLETAVQSHLQNFNTSKNTYEQFCGQMQAKYGQTVNYKNLTSDEMTLCRIHVSNVKKWKLQVDRFAPTQKK